MAALPSLPPSPVDRYFLSGSKSHLPMFVYETFAVATATQSSFDGSLQLLRVELLLFCAQVDTGGAAAGDTLRNSNVQRRPEVGDERRCRCTYTGSSGARCQLWL